MNSLTNNQNSIFSLKASDTNTHYLNAINLIVYQFDIIANRHGTLFFVDKSNMIVIEADNPDLMTEIKYLLTNHYKVKVQTNTIKEAINYWKGYPSKYRFTHHLYLRVIDNGDAIFLQQSESDYWCIASDVIYLTSAPTGPSNRNHFSVTQPHLQKELTTPHYQADTLQNLPDKRDTENASIKRLFEVTPLPQDKDLLVITWLVLTLLPRFEQTVLQITGDAQGGKTVTQQLLLSLIDPHEKLIRHPTKWQDIEPALLSTYVIAIDDAQDLPSRVQENLHQSLINYIYKSTKPKERPLIIDIRRPAILNGLEPVITRKELQKRTITIGLDEITDKHPKFPEPQDRTIIFSGLLDLLSKILPRFNDSWGMKDMPYEIRDYCHVGYLVSEVLEGDSNKFFQQLRRLQREQQEQQIWEHEVSAAIMEWLRVNPEGDTLKVSDWRQILKSYRPGNLNWPETPRGMSSRLKEAKRLLATQEIDVRSEGKSGSNGRWTIRYRKSQFSSIPSNLR